MFRIVCCTFNATYNSPHQRCASTRMKKRPPVSGLTSTARITCQSYEHHSNSHYSTVYISQLLHCRVIFKVLLFCPSTFTLCLFLKPLAHNSHFHHPLTPLTVPSTHDSHRTIRLHDSRRHIAKSRFFTTACDGW